jgi:ATP synthase protein I
MARFSRGRASRVAVAFFWPQPSEEQGSDVPLLSSQPILAILLAQAVAGILTASVLAVWQGQVAAVSALLGAAIAVVPNAFLAARLLAPGAGQNARAMLKAAWLGEIGKLALTALLFTVVFVSVRPLAAGAVFGGFIAAQLMVFGAPLIGGWLDSKDVKAKS